MAVIEIPTDLILLPFREPQRSTRASGEEEAA